MDKKKMLTTLFRVFLVVFGGLLMLESVIAYGARSFNLGVAMPFIIGLPLVILGVFYPAIVGFFGSGAFGRVVKWCFIAAYAGFFVLFSITTAVILINARPPKDAKPDVIIVLGAAIKGTEPTVQLRLRLEKAKECFEDNPDALIIVSGGQAADEECTEARAMKNWLVRNGVPESSVIEEGASTSTEENMLFSQGIIDSLVESGELKRGPSIVFVTNRFHVFRAERLSKRLGLNAEGLASGEYRRFMLNDYMRECAAIAQHFFTGRL